MKRLLILIAMATALACSGEPRRGDACSEEGSMPICEDNNTGLECKDGTYRAIPCRGQDGCRILEFDSACDVGDEPLEGDNCWSRFSGSDYCMRSDADKKIACIGGKWTASECVGCKKNYAPAVCQ